MAIKSETIKRAISPPDYYRAALPDVTLKRPGWNDGGLCPFHADNTRGSFRVNTETGGFKCFSCGAAGGDVIAYEQKIHGLSFPDAIAKLAKDWGLA
ncbi:MAG: CHC2 zinc finger domain-containing protein [Methylomonas lenta]|nr:CHC2 zinc finger domain-containing protein [Methylomonas lenta]